VEVTFLGWAALVAGIVALLLVDLLVLHRDAHEVSMRNAAWSTAVFVAISLAFGAFLAVAESRQAAGEFFAGYLLELSLSLDNVFVWALIFSAFSIPNAYQHRVLFYGIFGGASRSSSSARPCWPWSGCARCTSCSPARAIASPTSMSASQ